MTDELRAAAERLKSMIRLEHPGQCKLLSIGDTCECPLCDVERLVAGLAEHPADDDESCTCPTLDGVQVTGSACPVHGLPQSSLGDMTDDEPVTEEWLKEIGGEQLGEITGVRVTRQWHDGTITTKAWIVHWDGEWSLDQHLDPDIEGWSIPLHLTTCDEVLGLIKALGGDHFPENKRSNND